MYSIFAQIYKNHDFKGKQIYLPVYILFVKQNVFPRNKLKNLILGIS